MLQVRDAITLRRATDLMALALLPVLLMALYNTGHQANLVISEFGQPGGTKWQDQIINGLAIGYDPWNIAACFIHGALFFLPVLAVGWLICDLWEQIFSVARRRPRSGNLVYKAPRSLAIGSSPSLLTSLDNAE